MSNTNLISNVRYTPIHISIEYHGAVLLAGKKKKKKQQKERSLIRILSETQFAQHWGDVASLISKRS